jgi:hypothetical protein
MCKLCYSRWRLRGCRAGEFWRAGEKALAPVMDAPSVTGKASVPAAIWLPLHMYDFENGNRAEDAIAQSSGQ